ncbi:hypothetical protein HaloA020_19390 [Halomonas sp. A020]|uniref:hypothetical protein n=1 Tax=Halomonas sp. A020 TaxID=2717374 RepID=UPI002493BABC|nr:hypothetical protein [Halomonas sp. A020]BCB61238.1 hypothetical protein HaloA020_19390 [Halomonas sp. A020]
MTKEKGFCTKKFAFMISILTCLITLIFLLAFFVFISSPSLIDKISDFNLISVISANRECQVENCQSALPHKTDFETLSLKEAWSFQASLYQTIITFLIAINGFIAALSVLYIKTNSEDKAEDAAKSYVKSESFIVFVEKVILRKSRSKLRQLQNDYSSTTEMLEAKIEDFNEVKKECEIIKSENSDLKRQLNIISKKLAELDTKDNDGGSLVINRSLK